jgi:hypothetical protein
LVRKIGSGWRTRIVLLLSFVLFVETLDFGSAFAAGCGGYCRARLVRAICHETVRTKGLTARERDVEFDRCKGDPAVHRQIQELTDNNTDIFE